MPPPPFSLLAATSPSPAPILALLPLAPKAPSPPCLPSRGRGI
uniref:Uncharacterized protein n=1 Tax=Arundo donax TaxID=35708 RepID=A0A0A8XQJ4_ARUDO